ncbi:MAG: hypothetical protein ACRED5_02850 [Propylenella sp.]
MTALPDAPPSASGRWRWLVACVAPALVLVAIVLPFLRFHEYSLLLPESLILIAGAAAIGAAVGAISLLRPATLGPALMALTLCVFALYRQEINSKIFQAALTTAEFTGNVGVVLGVMGAAIFLSVLALAFLLRQHLQSIVVAVFSTFVLGTIVLPTPIGGEPRASGALPAELKDLPPVVHIVLDEHVGLAGLPADVEGSEAAEHAIRDTYADFELYSRAYSGFAETQYSLAGLLNAEPGPAVRSHLDLISATYVLHRSTWFERLKEKGYALQVYQTAWFDMCSEIEAVDSCYTYPLHSINAVQRSPLSTLARLRVLVGKLHLGREVPLPSALPAREALDRFERDIEATPRGVAYVVHLLLPHYGYLYHADCSLADPGEWGNQPGRDAPLELSTQAERRAAYRIYFDQLVCTQRQMAALFDRLKRLGVYDEATIIVHGDHGSRIAERTVHMPTDSLTERDLLDHFTTLLAIKAPGVEAGVEEAPVGLQQIFAERFLGVKAKPSATDLVWLLNKRTDEFVSRELAWPELGDGTSTLGAGLISSPLPDLRLSVE